MNIFNEKVEEKFEINLRPSTLKDYVGQRKVKQQIEIFVEAAKRKSEVLDHVLLSGPPGLGKTTLANIIAKELSVNIVITSGPVLEKKGDLAGILTSLEEGDILFIDEIHRLNPAVEEALYPAMEDYKIDILLGKGQSSKSIRLNVPKFTLIGATTRTGLLTTPLISRFGIILNFDYYDIETLKKVILRTAEILKIDIDEDGALEIAKRSRGTPRVANRILKRVYDYSLIKHHGKINQKIAKIALDFFEIDEYGLDVVDRRYLETLILKFNGGPVGLNTISSAISEDKGSIEEIIEPYLIRMGFISKTPKGRIATELAISHINNK
jgi:Holliday junction DNA helicase RuvB